MIDHAGLNVSDPVRSRRFYDGALAPLGYRVLREVPIELMGGRVVLGFVLDPDGHNIQAVCHKTQ